MPICAFDISPDGAARPVMDIDDRAAVPARGYRWVHFDRVDSDLDHWISDNVPELPGQALLQSQTRPRCDRQNDGLILNLRGVNLNADGPADQMVAVRLWVCAQTIVTVRMRKVFALDDLRQSCADGTGPDSIASFLLSLSEKLMGRVQDVVFGLADRVEDIEDTHSTVQGLPEDMGDLQRQTIRLHRYLSPQKAALHRLTDAVGDLFAASAHQQAHQREVSNQTTLLVEELEALKGRLAAVQDQHDSAHNAAQNGHAYVLSIVAAVFLPLGFLTGLFGVNVAGMPGLDNPLAFLWLCFVMVGAALLAVVILRLKNGFETFAHDCFSFPGSVSMVGLMQRDI